MVKFTLIPNPPLPPIQLILTTYAIPGYFQVYKNIEFLFLHTEIMLKLLDVNKSNNPH